jgi:hypothetical protein
MCRGMFNRDGSSCFYYVIATPDQRLSDRRLSDRCGLIMQDDAVLSVSSRFLTALIGHKVRVGLS